MADILGFWQDIGVTGDQAQAAGQSIGALGSGIGGLFAAQGEYAAAGAYGEAASLAKLQGGIQQETLNRQIYGATGQNKAAVASNGFQLSGSALNVVQQTAQQGGLAKGIAAINTQMQVSSYLAQQQAANAAGNADIFGGIAGIAGALMGII